MSFIDFLLEYYVWVLVVLIVLIVTIIGFLADKRMKLKKNKGEEKMENTNNNVVQTDAVVSPPSAVEPVSMERSLNNVENNGLNIQNNLGASVGPSSNNGLGYVPLSEQKPNIPPTPTPIVQNNDFMNNVGVNNAAPISVAASNAMPTEIKGAPTAVAGVVPNPVMEAPASQVVTSTMESSIPPAVQSATNSWDASTPVVEPMVNPIPQNVVPNAMPTEVQATPVANSWDAQVPVMEAPAPQVATSTMESSVPPAVQSATNSWDASTPVVEPMVNPAPQNVVPNAMPTEVQATPMANSWENTPSMGQQSTSINSNLYSNVMAPEMPSATSNNMFGTQTPAVEPVVNPVPQNVVPNAMPTEVQPATNSRGIQPPIMEPQIIPDIQNPSSNIGNSQTQPQTPIINDTVIGQNVLNPTAVPNSTTNIGLNSNSMMSTVAQMPVQPSNLGETVNTTDNSDITNMFITGNNG